MMRLRRPGPVRLAAVLSLGLSAVAAAETISISGSMVTLAPADDPQAVAVVTFENVQMNGGHDDGTYPLAMPGLTVEITFLWDAEHLTGADRVTVLPPPWIICQPASCAATVMEGFAGSVLLLPYARY